MSDKKGSFFIYAMTGKKPNTDAKKTNEMKRVEPDEIPLLFDSKVTKYFKVTPEGIELRNEKGGPVVNSAILQHVKTWKFPEQGSGNLVFLNKQGKEESITFKLVDPLDGPLIDKRLKEALKKLAESINQTKTNFGAPPTQQKGSFFTSKGSNFGILPKKDPPKTTDLKLSTEKAPETKTPETKAPETKAPETSSEPKGFFKTKKEKEQEKKEKEEKDKKQEQPKKEEPKQDES